MHLHQDSQALRYGGARRELLKTDLMAVGTAPLHRGMGFQGSSGELDL